MGTTVSANAEWIELFNNETTAIDLTGWNLVAGNGTPSISLAGSIPAGGYFLLERTSDASVPSVSANQIYTGALTNSGTTLTLTNVSSSVINQVDGGANWVNIGGDNASKETAQRTNTGWQTAAATPGAINAGVTNSSGGTESATTTQSVSGGGSPAEYIPVPTLRIFDGGTRTVSSDADTAFTAVVYDGKGNRRNDALVIWSFGDGVRKTGSSVFHAYHEQGEYAVVVHATTADGGDALSEVIVTVKDASILVSSVSARGIALTNDSGRTINLSLWRLSADGKEFKIPEDTQILSKRTVLFSSKVTGLQTVYSASLLYPNGEIAATFPKKSNEQLSVPVASYEERQVERSIEHSQVQPLTSILVQKNEEKVNAPKVAPIAAAALGAISEPLSNDVDGVLTSQKEIAPIKEKQSSGFFSSPWTLSFLGVMALAGSAFIFL